MKQALAVTAIGIAVIKNHMKREKVLKRHFFSLLYERSL